MIFRKIFLVTLSFGTMLTVSAAPPEETGPRTVLFPLRHAVLSSQVESSIDRHHHQEGEAFQEGDVLIQFDDSAIRQHLLRSQASTREAEAGLEYARKNRETVADLFKKGLQGQQEMDRANLEVEVAEARLLGMQATQKLNEKELADCTIRAPFSGVISDATYPVGGLLHPRVYGTFPRLIERYVLEKGVLSLPEAVRKVTRRPAELYGLEVLVPNINTDGDNTTRFIVISREKPTRGNRFSLLFTVDNKPGKLAAVIQKIGASGFNMESIKSRPMPHMPFEYYFYAELVGDPARAESEALLRELDRTCRTVRMLGVYTK